VAKFTVSTKFTAIDQVTSTVKKIRGSILGLSKDQLKVLGAIRSPLRGIRAAITGVAAALTTGVIARKLNEFANTGDEIAKTARMLGLSAEALQELRFAADREGVSAEDLNTGFRMMNKNLGEMQAGYGTLLLALKRTDPALARQLKTARNAEDAFLMLTEAIGKETDTSRRAALAQAAFGRSGQQLIKLAAAGADGIEALRKEARRLGLVIDNEAAAASERFQDSLTDLKAAGRGVMNVVLAPMIKNLVPLVKRITEWVVANRKLIGQRVQGAFRAIGEAIKFIMPYARSFFEILGWLRDRGILKWVIGGIIALTAAQWALNVALNATPIGAVIMALVALVGIVIIVRRHWAQITEFLRYSWNKVNEIFEKPGVQIALMMIAQPLLLILNTIRTIIDLLSGRGWKSFANMAGPWKTLTDKLGVTKAWGAGRWNKAGESEALAEAPMTPNAGMIESRRTEVSRTMVDVNLNNLPAGTSVKQRGQAPGFTLNTGFAFATGQGQGGLW